MPAEIDKTITDEQIRLAENISRFGLRVKDIGFVLGFSKGTFDRILRTNPKLVEAIEKGRAVAALEVTKRMYDLVMTGEHPALMIFWLKTQQQWRETNFHVHDLPQFRDSTKGTINLDKCTVEELKILKNIALRQQARAVEGTNGPGESGLDTDYEEVNHTESE